MCKMGNSPVKIQIDLEEIVKLFFFHFLRSKASEASGAEHLCYIVRNLPYHMEYENQGLQHRPLLCLNSIHNTVTIPLSKFHSLKLHLYSEKFQGETGI